MSLLDVALRAHSAPTRPKTRPWRKAVPGAGAQTKPLHVEHFPPPGAPRRPTRDLLWGTRDPEFKSRRPDEKVPGVQDFSVSRAVSADVESLR
jgi:hypothetical protein